MRIEGVRVRNFRILQAVDLRLDPGINLLLGDNGAGKSSFVEALVCLSRGKVRGGQPKERARDGGNTWNVAASVRSDGSAIASDRLEMVWDGQTRLSVNGKTVGARELSRKLVLAVADPLGHELFDSGPASRRRFLDWAMFHVEPDYAQAWSRWRRVLQQRNESLVRGDGPKAVAAWNLGLCESAEAVNACRQAHVAELAAYFERLAAPLLGRPGNTLSFQQGWAEAQPYMESLEAAYEGDLRAGRTRLGPQRADLVVKLGSRRGDQQSRGQQKMLLLGLMWAACELVWDRVGQRPVLVIDDFDAELSEAAKRRVAAALEEYPGQSVVTQHAGQPGLWRQRKPAMFHVEHGTIAAELQ